MLLSHRRRSVLYVYLLRKSPDWTTGQFRGLTLNLRSWDLSDWETYLHSFLTMLPENIYISDFMPESAWVPVGLLFWSPVSCLLLSPFKFLAVLFPSYTTKHRRLPGWEGGECWNPQGCPAAGCWTSQTHRPNSTNTIYFYFVWMLFQFKLFQYKILFVKVII